jgi:hypothetical protein
MNVIQRIWQKVSPNFLLVFIRLLTEPKNYKERRKAVLAHFRNVDQSRLPSEIREALKFLKYHKFSSFPYKWTQKYETFIPEVFRDKPNNCYFILFEGKKMYFPKRYTETEVIWAVRSILKEQDPLSPHRYLSSDFQVETGSVVIDAGVAEGNFALMVIDKAKLLYLIECNSEWIDALKLTFAPWKEKVVFVEKYMSDIHSNETTSIDTLVIPEPDGKYFIKLDIEGSEQKALAGMKRLLESGRPIKMDICTYHNPNDLNEISDIVKSYGFSFQVSDGYVLYFQTGEEPSFRKVLIRATINC